MRTFLICTVMLQVRSNFETASVLQRTTFRPTRMRPSPPRPNRPHLRPNRPHLRPRRNLRATRNPRVIRNRSRNQSPSPRRVSRVWNDDRMCFSQFSATLSEQVLTSHFQRNYWHRHYDCCMCIVWRLITILLTVEIQLGRAGSSIDW